jgi:HD superfamily phosphodiesterase
MEEMDEKSKEILEAAAIVHDIGIKVSLDKYGKSSGKLQEIEGPPFAEEMLRKLGYEDNVIRRVSYLVGHHHTYDNIEGLDYQILVEADFLVNLCEKDSDNETVKETYLNIFKTPSGKKICREMFNI